MGFEPLLKALFMGHKPELLERSQELELIKQNFKTKELKVKVTALTKGGEIPVLIVGLIAVKVVDRQGKALTRRVGVAASLTAPISLILYPGGNLVPVVRVAVTHFLTLPGAEWHLFARAD